MCVCVCVCRSLGFFLRHFNSSCWQKYVTILPRGLQRGRRENWGDWRMRRQSHAPILNSAVYCSSRFRASHWLQLLPETAREEPRLKYQKSVKGLHHCWCQVIVYGAVERRTWKKWVLQNRMQRSMHSLPQPNRRSHYWKCMFLKTTETLRLFVLCG